MSVSPDIRIENLEVKLKGQTVNGLSIAAVKCRNNVKVSRYSEKYGITLPMTLGLKLRYDNSSPDVKQALKNARYPAGEDQ